MTDYVAVTDLINVWSKVQQSFLFQKCCFSHMGHPMSDAPMACLWQTDCVANWTDFSKDGNIDLAKGGSPFVKNKLCCEDRTRCRTHIFLCHALDHRSSHAPACGSCLGCVAPLRILNVTLSQHVSSTTP